jgi:hypothetical protein
VQKCVASCAARRHRQQIAELGQVVKHP